MSDYLPTDFTDDEVVTNPQNAVNGRVVGRTRSGVLVEFDAVGGGREAPVEMTSSSIEKPEGRAAWEASRPSRGDESPAVERAPAEQ